MIIKTSKRWQSTLEGKIQKTKANHQTEQLVMSFTKTQQAVALTLLWMKNHQALEEEKKTTALRRKMDSQEVIMMDS